MSLDKTNSTKSSKDAVPSSEPYKKRRITDNDINEPTIELVTGLEDNQIQRLTSVKTSDNSKLSLKQQALAEILKGPKTDSDTEEIEQSLVLQIAKNKNLESRKEKVSDLEAFRREVESLPDEADIDYDSVPIEDFGAAMLRGMGWRPGMTIGKNQKIKSIELREPKARPTHLGLGASPLPTKDAHGLR
ncbi:23931_t:CDS:2 [Dentiscutata erythropus]|uniref:23931_t:CDS:1 n=1 Tax=Dentiscutata erythropus TaxID=1348616 RepID=A0A9N9NZX8_9GLOM|nr:23931_t:CDS:2 [Dentiscutata erythropus]